MENSTGKTALALVVGIAAGAALGLLFAPRSGKETRAALRRKGDDLGEGLDELLERASKDWSKAKGKVADMASMTKDEVRDFIRYLFTEGRHMADRMKDEVDTAANDVAGRAKKTADDLNKAARSN